MNKIQKIFVWAVIVVSVAVNLFFIGRQLIAEWQRKAYQSGAQDELNLILSNAGKGVLPINDKDGNIIATIEVKTAGAQATTQNEPAK